MPWAVLFAGVVPTLEMQRTAPIADLGHAVTQDGRDGPVSPDVAALAGIGTVVRSRLVPHPVKHGDPVPFRSASYAPGGAFVGRAPPWRPMGRRQRSRQRIANLPPAWNYRLAPKSSSESPPDGALCPFQSGWRRTAPLVGWPRERVAHIRSPPEGCQVDGSTVRNVGHRPGDRLRSVDSQHAATVTDLANVRAWQGEGHVPKPPSVLACLRVGFAADVGSVPKPHESPSPLKSGAGAPQGSMPASSTMSMRAAVSRWEGLPGLRQG